MTTIKLHLMNDRGVMKSVTVEEGKLAEEYHALLDLVLEDIEDYSSDSFDNGLVKGIMTTTINQTKSLPVTKENILAFSTGDPAVPQDIYSVVYHEVY